MYKINDTVQIVDIEDIIAKMKTYKYMHITQEEGQIKFQMYNTFTQYNCEEYLYHVNDCQIYHQNDYIIFTGKLRFTFIIDMFQYLYRCFSSDRVVEVDGIKYKSVDDDRYYKKILTRINSDELLDIKPIYKKNIFGKTYLSHYLFPVKLFTPSEEYAKKMDVKSCTTIHTSNFEVQYNN